MAKEVLLPLFTNIDISDLPPFPDQPGLLITPINKDKKSFSQKNYLNTVYQNRKRQQWGGGSKPKTDRVYKKANIGDIFVCFSPATRRVLYAGFIRDTWDEGCPVGHETVGWNRWSTDGGVHVDAYGRHMVHVQAVMVPQHFQDGTTSILSLLTTRLNRHYKRDDVLLETIYIDYAHSYQFVEEIRKLN